MKKITFTADEDVIERARQIARSQNRTLGAAFREWLLEFTQQASAGQDFDILMARLRYVRAGRRFTHEEMNNK
jgi:predicted transcriptional regulator